MKISAVIEKTSLTDRAIRLYIDNGLVAPSIEENYSGRKNIDFSEDDVDRLIKISLLRKVGFSIADIKELVAGGESAKNVLARFLDETESNLDFQRNMVGRLRLIPFDTDISIDTVCDFINDIDGNYTIPKEDLEISQKEKSMKKFTTIFGISVISLSVLSFVFFVFLEPVLIFKFFNFDYDYLSLSILLNSGWLITSIISLLLIYINISKKMILKSLKLRETLSGIIIFISIIVIVFSAMISFLSILLSCKSETSDIENYLILDDESYVENDSFYKELFDVFPSKVPDSALKLGTVSYDERVPLTTHYYYCYTHTLDPHINIIAEWVLPDNEFKAEKERLSGKELYLTQKGDWTCLYFTEDFELDNWENETYRILIFAYNDKTNKVRYIAADIVDSYEYGPYYLSLDW